MHSMQYFVLVLPIVPTVVPGVPPCLGMLSKTIMPTTDTTFDATATTHVEETSTTRIASATTGAMSRLTSGMSNPCRIRNQIQFTSDKMVPTFDSVPNFYCSQVLLR